jgi:hypothetical protein
MVMGAAPFFDGLNHKLTGSPRVMTAELVASVRDRVWNASNARIRRELGWPQTVPPEASLRDMTEAIRSNSVRRSSDPPAAPSG